MVLWHNLQRLLTAKEKRANHLSNTAYTIITSTQNLILNPYTALTAELFSNVNFYFGGGFVTRTWAYPIDCTLVRLSQVNCQD